MPATLAEYEHWLGIADPIRDAPLRRWLGFVIADVGADLAEGRATLAASGTAEPHPTGPNSWLRCGAPVRCGEPAAAALN